MQIRMGACISSLRRGRGSRGGEKDADLGAFSDIALQLQTGIVILRGVLDDGKAEARTADRLGVALVHAVEALEYAALMRVGNADAGVGDGEQRLAAAGADTDGDAAAVTSEDRQKALS